MKIKAKKQKNKNECGQSGFSLVEATIALVVLLIVVLGVFTALVFAINYNTANTARSKALVVLQREKENLRAAKFTSSLIDTGLLGGIKDLKTIVTNDGNKFNVAITVDDDPFTSGIQIDSSKTLKEIVITVSPIRPTAGWQTAIPATVTLRRVRAN